MLVIDGDIGEGGGQVLRTALALSVCRQIPFQMIHIRARRHKPGLQPQHLAAVQAAASISGARVENASIGSQDLYFQPNSIYPGDYRFAIGTAGSVTLLAQTILPALMLAPAPSTLRIEGGTHNPLSPPFEFFAQAFCPLLARMGVRIHTTLERPGFYPKGGGIMHITLAPVHSLKPLHLLHRGALQQVSAQILLAHLPTHIAQRERHILNQTLAIDEDNISIQNAASSFGPGNTVSVFVRSEHVTEVFTGFGQRGVPAETVASGVAAQVTDYLQAGVPVGHYLADQLLIPLALAGGGEFVTQVPSSHTTTNMAVITLFTDMQFSSVAGTDGQWRIALMS